MRGKREKRVGGGGAIGTTVPIGAGRGGEMVVIHAVEVGARVAITVRVGGVLPVIGS